MSALGPGLCNYVTDMKMGARVCPLLSRSCIRKRAGFIETVIKMFRQKFAVGRQNNVVVCCRYFKDSQASGCKRTPMSFLPFGIADAAEHRDVPGIGFRNIVAARSAANPIVQCSPVIVGNGLSKAQPQDIPPLPSDFAYPIQLFKESKETSFRFLRYLLVGCGLGLTAAWIAFLGYELLVLIGLSV